MPTTTNRTARTGIRRRKEGFSLVEVALAIMVAASGMVACFSLFPTSLRQEAASDSDLGGALFGSALLETIAGNVRQIDDIADWNDPEKWWTIAIAGTGLPIGWDTGRSAEKFKEASDSDSDPYDSIGFAAPTVDLAARYVPPKTQADKQYYANTIRYFGEEKDTVDTTPPALALLVPPTQYLVRLEVVKRRALDPDGTETDAIPNRYLVSLVSSGEAYPQIYIHDQVYAQEYYFVHRP